MFKTFSAVALSLTLVMTSLGATATPARAGNDDVAKILFGALALGIIAKGISDSRDNDNNSRVTVTTNRNNAHNVVRPNRNQAQRIPSRCAREMRIGNRGNVRTIYRRACLRRAGIRVAQARECMRTGVVRGNNINYYTPRCLRRSGFRL